MRTKKGRIWRVVGEVPRADGRTLSYEEFRVRFMLPNRPVLITGLMDHWPACKDWTLSSPLCHPKQHRPNQEDQDQEQDEDEEEETLKPNLRFLIAHFGSSRVQVTDCDEREFSDQKRLDMTVSEYIEYWELLASGPQDGASKQSLYLKDWHLVKEYPHYSAYATPSFFRDDWLNAYMDSYSLHPSENTELPGKEADCNSDYRFVYMGPKGTWTPIHADVFRSYSWSGNVCGRKLWYLLPPSETSYLFDRYKRNTIFDLYAQNSVEEFPHLDKASWLECEQVAGEIIFVPSGWYHQVINLEDTISINHNWFNSFNLHWVWNLLNTDYEEARASIEDIRDIADDFESLCQRNLAANSGMHYNDLLLFLNRMTRVWIILLLGRSGFDTKYSSVDIYKFIDQQILDYFNLEPQCEDKHKQVIFNLFAIKRVVESMLSGAVLEQEVYMKLEANESSLSHSYSYKPLLKSHGELDSCNDAQSRIDHYKVTIDEAKLDVTPCYEALQTLLDCNHAQEFAQILQKALYFMF